MGGNLLGERVDTHYADWTIAKLPDAPVSAFQGVSESDAQRLKEAFNIKTIRDLGTNKYFLWAQAIVALASPDDVQSSPAQAEVSISLYLETDDELVARSVLESVNDLANVLGFGAAESYGEERGSFLARWRSKVQTGLSSSEVRSRLVKVERAVELAHLDKAQAEVDAKEAEAFAHLLKALEDVPSACIRIGSLLVVKFRDARDQPFVFCRTLSQLELRVMEKYPEIQKTPSEVLTHLAMATEAESTSGLPDSNDRQ